jgi:hypothetical protein
VSAERAVQRPTGRRRRPLARSAPWFEDLRDDSVVIPVGHSREVDHQRLLRRRRTRLAGVDQLQDVAGQVALHGADRRAVAWFLLRRTDWDEVEPRPIRRRRRLGQIIRAASRRTSASRSSSCLRLGLHPAAILAGVLGELLDLIPASTDAGLLGTASGTNLVVALLIGSLVNLAPSSSSTRWSPTTWSATTTASTARCESRSGTSPSARHRRCFGRAYASCSCCSSARSASRRRVPARALPVHRPDRDARGARWSSGAAAQRALTNRPLVAHGDRLGRTQRLVLRRRRRRTAARCSCPGLPLWAFSALAAVVYAVLVPLAAISMTLLYGDAVAEHEGCRRRGWSTEDERRAVATDPA